MTPQNSEKLETAILIQRARQGDGPAYEVLFTRVAERLLFYIRARLGPTLRRNIDSLDLLQEVYLQAHKSFAGFEYRGDRSFLSWLVGIAENRARDLAEHYGAKKRASHGREVPVDRILESARTLQSGPGTRAERAEERELVAHCLDELADDERNVLLLRYFEGKTYDEIAAATGQSVGPIRKLIGRGLRRLGRELGVRTQGEFADGHAT